jgi:hypothetical protein
VQKIEDNRIEHYKLTFHGVLTCSEAKDDVQMLLRYIDFLKKKYEENPAVQEVTSTEVEQSLKLSKEQSIRLSALIDLGNLYAISATSLGRAEWKAGVPDDIEDIVEANSPEEYLKKRLRKEEERQKELEKVYSERKIDRVKLLAWLSFNVNLWLAEYILFSSYHKILSDYPNLLIIPVAITIWFALYSVIKVLEDIFRKEIPFFSSKIVLEKWIWWLITIGISGIGGWIAIKVLLRQ